jgi:hypothetical protein
LGARWVVWSVAALTEQLRRIVVFGLIAVVAFDALAAVASRRLSFWYPYATIGSWLIYATVGLLAGRAASVRAAAATGAALGFVEATLGWAISWLIGPGRVSLDMYAVGIVALVIVVVTLVGAGIGALGGLAGCRATRRATQRSSPLMKAR